MKEMDELFKHICVIFLSKFCKKANDSVKVISGLHKRNASNLQMDEAEEETTEWPRDEFNLEISAAENKQTDTIYRNSPYCDLN